MSCKILKQCSNNEQQLYCTSHYKTFKKNIFIHFIDRLTNIFVDSMRTIVIALLCYGALEIVAVLLLLLLLKRPRAHHEAD